MILNTSNIPPFVWEQHWHASYYLSCNIFISLLQTCHYNIIAPCTEAGIRAQPLVETVKSFRTFHNYLVKVHLHDF